MRTIAPHTPIQYIIGKTQFCGHHISVDDRVLIPRPETEGLVEAVKELIGRKCGHGESLAVLDLCTGSGNIAISLAHDALLRSTKRNIDLEGGEGLTNRTSECTIVASDISQEALDLARLNAGMNGVADRIKFVASDLFSGINGRFDIIVSNPPYVARHEFSTLQPEVLREPRIALDGGDDGLDYYRAILSGCKTYLKPGGFLAMEIGFGQRRAIADIIESTGLMKLDDVRQDQAGIDRVVVVSWKN